MTPKHYPRLFRSVTRWGFVYDVQLLRAGRVIAQERVKNLNPVEGMNHILNAAFKGGTQVTDWYLGLFEGDYTPVLGDTMATFPGLASEFSDYDEATRQLFDSGTPSGGSISNVDNMAEFTLSADATIYGGFMSSVSAKGATSGVLVSAVKFASPKVGTAGDVLRMAAANVFVSE